MNKIKTTLVVVIATSVVVVAAGFASSRSTTFASSDSVAVVAPERVRVRLQEGLPVGRADPDERGPRLGHRLRLGKGDIVTNAHVVGTAKTFTVTTSTGKHLTGKLVGVFVTGRPRRDQGERRRPPAGDVRELRQAPASATSRWRIGNPLGLSSSFTEGIVSALNRPEPEGNGVVLPNAIQTSAAINPGNSGGALVDIERLA